MIHVDVGGKNFPLKKEEVRDAAADYLRSKRQGSRSAEVLIVSAKKMASLNQKFKKKAGATDVLSFPLEPIPGEQSPLIGTIVICGDIIKSRSTRAGRDFKDELGFVLRHGLDHLLGIHHH